MIGRHCELIWILGCSVVIGACAPPEPAAPADTIGVTGVRYLAAPSDERFARVTGPRPFSFPADHAAHPEYRTEWWYFTGNLLTDQARHFGYELTFFRIGGTAFLGAFGLTAARA